MKKKVFGKRLSRDVSARRALFRSLIKALVTHGVVKTTKPKSKAVQSEIEKIVSLAKKNTISTRRRVYSMLGADRGITDIIFAKIAPAFSDKNSGFTRIINLSQRKGDKAQVVRFEWSKKIEIETKGVGDKSKKNKPTEDKKAKSSKKAKKKN